MRLKLIAGIVVSMAAAVILAAYIILSSYDWNRFKPMIAQRVRDATGRELTIGGDIDLRIGLSPALFVEDVGFENSPWGSRSEMAKIKRIEVEAALLPLIFGDIRIKRFVLIEPDILIETDRTGRLNSEFITSERKVKEPQADKTGLPPLTLKELRIEKGNFTYRDGRSGKTSTVAIDDLAASGSFEKLIFKLRGKYDGKPFEVSGRTSMEAPGTYGVSDLRVLFEKSEIKGSIEAALSGKRPDIKAEFSSDNIDLRPFMSAGKAEKSAKKARVFSDSPLPFDALKKADASVKFHAAKLLLSTIALNDLAFSMALKDGVLAIKPLKAQMGGGTLAGSVDLDSGGKTPRLSATFAAEGVDLGKMLKELGVTKTFEGKIDIGINVKGSGGSIRELMAGLNGAVNIVMGKGQIDNKYLGLLSTDIRTGAMRLVNPAAEKTERTKINCVVCGFDINNGLAEATALVFDTEAMSVIGGGGINLKTEGLNISLKPVPKEGALGGRVSMSVSELAKPFKLGGTLSRPKLALDPAQTALTVGKALRGVALFGPAGIAMALVNVNPEGDKNPCLSAMEAARSGKRPEKKGVVDKTTEGIKGVGEEIKKLFGR